MMLNGMQSDPDVPGTEKLVVCQLQDQWLVEKHMFLSPNDLDLISENASGLAGPQEVFAVKGWNRSCCGLLVLLAASELPHLLEARFMKVTNAHYISLLMSMSMPKLS